MEMAVKAELASHARPELTSKHSGMKLVKDIVLVVPNWWNALPPAVNTFLDGDGGKDIECELRKLLPKTRVMPVVEISDKDTDDCDEKVARAIDELLTNN